MNNRANILRHKRALLGNEAAAQLGNLIDSDLTASELLQVGVHNGLRVFVETDGLSLAGFTAADSKTGKAITPTGLQEVVQGLKRHVNAGEGGGGNPALEFGDDGYVFSGASTDGENVEWVVSGEPAPNVRSTVRTAVFRFRPADIQALADKLNDPTPVTAQDNEPVGNWPLIAAAFAEQALADGRTNPTSLIERIASKRVPGLGKTQLWERWRDIKQAAKKTNDIDLSNGK